MTLWDTAGGERFRTLTNNFYRDSNGAMLIYSVEDSYTFENLNDWIEDALPHIDPDTIEWALIGNKCDCKNDVEKKNIDARLKELGAKIFYHVSAKTGQNVKEAFHNLINAIHKKSKETGRPRQNTIRVDSTASTGDAQKKPTSCC